VFGWHDLSRKEGREGEREQRGDGLHF